MKKIFTHIALVLCVVISSNIYAQNSASIWKPSSKNYESIQGDKWDVNSVPLNYQVFYLDVDSFFQQIQSAPNRVLAKSASGIIISFPTMEGDLENYEVYDAPVLAQELQAELPNVRSFIGKSLRNENKIIRFSISLFGLKAIILNAEEGTQYIDCITKDRQSYMMYFKRDIDPIEAQINCLTDDQEFSSQMSNAFDGTELNRNADDGVLRDYRLALSCTEEFSTYYVNSLGLTSATDTVKKDAILNVMNDFMTRVNGVYETELSLTMTLISNNRDVIFLQDSFLTNETIATLINESQTFINAFAGSGNYDIGHMLSTSGSGLAQLYSPCTGNKARGVSGGLGGPPIGLVYENVILHEMGHQYGATHTFTAPGCSGTYTAGSAVEPGGGTTIMSYAGICGSAANIQATADDYFHQFSIQQMWNYIRFGDGSCAAQTNTFNDEPTVDAGSNYIIPVGTPYRLVGFGSDSNGDNSLTYTWEQTDANGPEAIPTITSATGPVVRSFPPSISSTRYVPRLEDYVTLVNNSTDWEKLVVVSRDLSFAFTARDNDIAGGQTATDFMTVTLDNSAGPFRVTSQNTPSTVYQGNSVQNITWSVSNTTSAPINTSNVNILLSTDGGLNFDIVLLANTPNDGSEDVTMANVDSSTCRIMVEAVNNIFYNINARDFEIEESLSLDDQLLENSLLVFPNPNKGEFNIKFNSVIRNPVSVNIYDIRGRRVFDNVYNEKADFNEVIRLDAIQSGMYLLEITAGESSIIKKIVIE